MIIKISTYLFQCALRCSLNYMNLLYLNNFKIKKLLTFLIFQKTKGRFLKFCYIRRGKPKVKSLCKHCNMTETFSGGLVNIPTFTN